MLTAPRSLLATLLDTLLAPLLAAVVVALLQPAVALADFTPAERTRFESAFLQAHTNHLAATNQYQPAWQFALAAFDWADAQSNDRDRARIAQIGIDTCHAALALQTNGAEAHYFLALNLGQLAQTKTLGALRIVPRIEQAFLAALASDETIDNAGPDRGLGLLYFEAPGWPTSVGSRTKARNHLLHAVELAPLHPGNRLALAEALLEWRERSAARDQLDAIDRDWAANRTRLADPKWDADWRVWLSRRNNLAGRFKLPPIPLDPPPPASTTTNSPAPSPRSP
jgi:hypothetical protein